MNTLFTHTHRQLSMKVVMLFLFVLAAYVQSSAQGYLKNSSTTTHTTGVTITEVSGFGNPSHDWNGDGAVNSTSDEFVELTNNSTDSIDISGWIIGDNINNYFFPNGTILGPGKKAVVFQRSSTFGNATPSSLQAGPSNFNPGDSNYAFQWGTGLANGGDVVGLKNKAGVYIAVKFNGTAVNSTITTGSSLAGVIPNNTTASSSASWRRQFYNSDVWTLHPVISGKTYNWSLSSNVVVNPAGSPGRDSSGTQFKPLAPQTSQGLTFGSVGSNSITITGLTNSFWNNRRMIVVREAVNVNFTPTDTVSYSGVNAAFTTAVDQGSGNKIVFDGFTTSNPVTVTGLSPNTKYYFSVFEYNGKTPNSDISYRTNTIINDSQTTAASSNPTVTLSVSATSGTEANSTSITVTATASAAVMGAQSVSLGVSGTGITANDYDLSSTTINIANGQTVGTVTFTVNNDTIGEGSETAVLTISSPSSGLTIGSPSTRNITITDNEPGVSVSFSPASSTEGDSVVVWAVLTDTVMTSTQSVNVSINGVGVTASDYSLSASSFSFLPGEDSAFVKLYIKDDNIREATETFVSTLSSPSSRMYLASVSSNLTVTDNDDAISISVLNTALPADTFDNVIATPGSQMYKGWYTYEIGTAANGTYDTTSGFGSPAANIYSMGVNGSSERAIGSLCAGSLDTAIYGAKYINNTGGNINNLTVSYVGEIWRYMGSADKLEFQYSLNASSVYDLNATWVDVNTLDFNTPASAANGGVNGNSSANRVIYNNISFALSNSVANGGTFFVRFIDVNSSGTDAGVAVDSFVMLADNIVNVDYYSFGAGNLNDENIWYENANGTGNHPNNFTASGQTFHIQDQSTYTINNNWVVSGNGSKVILGDSINAVTFIVPANFTFTGNITLKNLGKLKMLNSTLPNITSIGVGSTIEYAHASAYTVPNTISYYNLTLSGAGTKTFSGNTTTILGNLSYDNASVDFPGSSPFSTIALSGNIKYFGTVAYADTARNTSITTVGNGVQTISTNGNDLHIFNIISTKTAGGLYLYQNSPLKVRGDLRLNMSGSATFQDSSNNIYIADDFQTDGNANNYNLTGTIIMRANTGTGNIEQNTSGGTPVARLNNVTWNLTGTAVGNFGGTNPVYIDGNFSITSANIGNINLATNDYFIKGHYVNSRNADVLAEGTSHVTLNGSATQNIYLTYSGGERFYDLTLDNVNHFNSNTIRITDTLRLTHGVVNMHSDVIIEAGGDVVRVDGWVNGSMIKEVVTGATVPVSYEIGDSLNYLPVDLVFSNVTVAGSVQMVANETSIAGTAYANICIDSNKTIDRRWKLAGLGGVDFDTYSATVRYAGTDTTSGGASTPNVLVFGDNGVNIEKSTISSLTTSSITVTGDTLQGYIYIGEARNITSTFTKSTPTPCLSSNITLTYTGTGVGTSNYSWSLSGASIVSGSGSGPYTINWGSTGVKPLSLTVTGLGCASSTSYDTVTVFANGWIGSVDTLWTRAANWCSGTVPTSSSNIVIPAGLTNYPTLHATANCGDLTIASGASLKIVSGGNLTVNGVYTNNGTFTHVSGYLNLAATTNIPAGNYFALRLNSASAATYTLSGDINVANVFLMTGSSSNVLNTNGYNVNLYNDVTINSTVNGTGNLNFVKTSGYQTITGVNGVTNINNAVFNNAVSGGTRISNSMKIEKITLTQGTVVINSNVTLTAGSSGCSTCDITTTGGTILGGSSSTTANLVIEGGASAPTITNLKYSSNGSLTLNRVNGVKLGANMLVGNTTTLNNGATIDMNGYNLQIGTTSQALGIITTNSGTIKNNNATGLLSILGNASAPAITNLVLDTMRNVTVNRPNGLSLGGSFVLNGAATLANGDVDLNGKVVTLGTSASISEAANQTFKGDSGYLVVTRTFGSPLSNNNIAGLGLKLTTSGATGATSIVRGHTISTHGSSNSSKRYFSIAVANPQTTNYFEFNYDSTELAGAVRSNLKLYKTADTGLTWVNYNCNATTANTATGRVYINNMNLTTNPLKFTISDSVNAPLSPVFVGKQIITPSKYRVMNNKNISVYPNPFSDNLTIELQMPTGIYAVECFDLNGKRIYTNNFESNGMKSMLNLETQQMASGMYIISIKGENTQSIIKVVKE